MLSFHSRTFLDVFVLSVGNIQAISARIRVPLWCHIITRPWPAMDCGQMGLLRSPHRRKPRLSNSRKRSLALGSCNADILRCFSASPMFDSLTKLPDTAMESSRFSTLWGHPAGTKRRWSGVSSTLQKFYSMARFVECFFNHLPLQRPNGFCASLDSSV